MKRNYTPRQLNQFGLCLIAAALLTLLSLLTLPLVSYTTVLDTQRSPNTFVGDETYTAIRADFDEKAKTLGAEVTEQVTERTNSKGKTTSLVVFILSKSGQLTGWHLLGARVGLFSSVLAAMVLLSIAALALSLAGSLNSLDTLHQRLTRGQHLLRSAGCLLSLAALLCVPVFCMALNHTISRSVTLYNLGSAPAGFEALLPRLNALFYQGSAGEDLCELLSGLDYRISPIILMLMACFLVSIIGTALVTDGNVTKSVSRGALYLFVISTCVFILYPFFVMLITGLRSNTETTDMYFLHILPTKWVFSNLVDIMRRGVLRYLMNSVILACGATAIAMLCGIPAAYAMARMPFKGKNAYLGFIIMSQMFSPVVLLVGISTLMNTLHLNNSIVGLMLINAAFNQAFAIWLLYGTFSSISAEMEQAACIDGCGTVGALINILLPMAAPGIVTTLIFIFINAWNEYTISTVLISADARRPITVGITQFSSFNMIEWQYLFAAALIATIPVVILFMCIEKHLAAGLTSGGVKG